MPKLDLPLTEVKAVVKKWLYLEDEDIIDAILGTIVANQLSTDPLWTMIIAPPSSSKTELLRSLQDCPRCHFLSNLTPSTLVSGIIPRRTQPDPSLLLQLNDKVLVLKDFTSVLVMRSENQQEILGQLREIYDGQYAKQWGNGKAIDWKGQIGFLGACTPVFDKHHAVLASLGERFILYRHRIKDQRAAGRRARENVGKGKAMRAEIAQTIQAFLKQFDKLSNLRFTTDETVDNMIVSLATFCALGRTPVSRDRFTQIIDFVPEPEGTPRLIGQITALGLGMALVNGKTVIGEEIYRILRKVGSDLLSSHREAILRHLWAHGAFEHDDRWETTKAIAAACSIPSATAIRRLEDLQQTGLLNRTTFEEADPDPDEPRPRGRQPYHWQITEVAWDLISSSGVFDR